MPLLFWPQTSPNAIPHLKAYAESLQRNQTQQAVKEGKDAVGIDGRSAAAHMLQHDLGKGTFLLCWKE